MHPHMFGRCQGSETLLPVFPLGRVRPLTGDNGPRHATREAGATWDTSMIQCIASGRKHVSSLLNFGSRVHLFPQLSFLRSPHLLVSPSPSPNAVALTESRAPIATQANAAMQVFNVKLDAYGGVLIDPEGLPSDCEAFEASLRGSLEVRSPLPHPVLGPKPASAHRTTDYRTEHESRHGTDNHLILACMWGTCHNDLIFSFAASNISTSP
jgi:hypothetical protein